MGEWVTGVDVEGFDAVELIDPEVGRGEGWFVDKETEIRFGIAFGPSVIRIGFEGVFRERLMPG